MTSDHEFSREFSRMNILINELYHDIAAKQGLSDSAYSILQAMYILGDGCTQTDIYKYSGLNKQTVNSSVRKLITNGVLTLLPGGGREKKLVLTDAGNAVVREKIIPIEKLEQEVFEEMTQAERDEILRLVDKYLSAFRRKLERRDE